MLTYSPGAPGLCPSAELFKGLGRDNTEQCRWSGPEGEEQERFRNCGGPIGKGKVWRGGPAVSHTQNCIVLSWPQFLH